MKRGFFLGNYALGNMVVDNCPFRLDSTANGPIFLAAMESL